MSTAFSDGFEWGFAVGDEFNKEKLLTLCIREPILTTAPYGFQIHR